MSEVHILWALFSRMNVQVTVLALAAAGYFVSLKSLTRPRAFGAFWLLPVYDRLCF